MCVLWLLLGLCLCFVVVCCSFRCEEGRGERAMAAFTKVPGGKEKELPTNVTSVYMHVVEDVIENVRADFQSDGVEDAVLIELQAVCCCCFCHPFVLSVSFSLCGECVSL